jgi:hypothetical protein
MNTNLWAANEAKIQIRGQSVVLRQFVAFSTKEYGETRIVVLATSQPVSPAQLKKITKKSTSDNYDSELDQAYLKAVYADDGTAQGIGGWALNTSFFSTLEQDGSAKINAGKITGSVQMVEDGDFAKTITMSFQDVPMGIGLSTATNSPQPLDPPVQPTVKGTFTGNGKNAELKFISVQKHEEFNGKRAVTIIFTEKDHTKDPKASINAVFGKHGSALLLSVDETGGIFGCEVAHAAHQKSPFTSLGQISMVEFDFLKGNAQGHVQTAGELDFFEQKWSADLTFAAPVPPDAIKEWAKTTAKTNSDEDDEDDEDDDEEMDEKAFDAAFDDDDDKDEEKPKPARKAKPTLSASDLPFPSSVKNLTYKTLVEQITFDSELKVGSLADDIQKSFLAKGWKSTMTPLVNPKSAVLKLANKDADVTIMLRATGNTSAATLFSNNLDWSNAPKKASASKKDDDEDDDFEKEALDTINEVLKDALKE